MKTTTTQIVSRDKHPVRYLISGAALLLTTTLAFGQAVKSQDDTNRDDTVKLEPMEVTGSRIKRLDAETVSPVMQLTATDIQAKGFMTFADAIRSLPFNNGQALIPIDAGSSFTPGINTFNLRGLGTNSTLVLINGRRAAVYAAPGYNGFMSMFDLNSLPDNVIESVELLKDGGSAIYGSDAVAGVLNVKLRKDYTGAEAMVEYGNFFNTSASMKQVAITAGATSGKASILVSAQWRDQGGIMARDLWYARNSDLSDIAHKAKPRFFLTGGGDPDVVPYPGYSTPLSDYKYYGWFDNSSGSGIPGYVGIPTVDEDDDGPYLYNEEYTTPGLTNNPTQAGMTYGRHYYNFQQDTSFFDESRNYSFYTSARYDFTDYLSARLEVGLSHNESQSMSAPAPATLASENGLYPGQKMHIPKTNPYNPWGGEIVHDPDTGDVVFDGNIYAGGRRMIEAGPRINDVTANSPRILLAFEGKLPDNSFFKDWTWEVGILYASSEVTNTNPGQVIDYKLQQALYGLVDDGNGGLLWDADVALPTSPGYDPSRLNYFNWFGINDERFGQFITAMNPTIYDNVLQSYDIRIGGPVYQLPAGPIAVSFGAEHYMQRQSVTQTDLNATGNLVGGSQGPSWDGSRTVNAVYAEVNVPITKWLEAQAAGRFEKFSDDGFQERVRPKIGFKVRPFDWLIVRASYAQSYRAPDLAFINAATIVTFTSSFYIDPVTNENIQLQVHAIGDRDLKPETTDTYYAGIAADVPRGRFKGLGASLDFWRYEQKNLLAQISDFYGYRDILWGAADPTDPSHAFFAGMVKRDPGPAQTLLYIEDPYLNISDRKTQGVDVEIYYKWATQRFGQFRASLMGTYTDSDKIDGDSILGTPWNRRFVGNAILAWRHRDWEANVMGQYIRGTDMGFNMLNVSGQGTFGVEYTIKPQYIVNAQVSYKGFWNTRITLGVTNLFNQRPPVDLYSTLGIVDGVNYVLPAFWSLRISKEF